MKMELGTTQQLRQRMEMTLAPRMIQSMEILQLPMMALQERIQQELEENPVLEVKQKQDEEEFSDSNGQLEQEDPDSPSDLEQELIVDDQEDELDFDRLDTLTKDWEDYYNEEHIPSRNGIQEWSDKKMDAMNNMPARSETLQDVLLQQLAFFDLDEEMQELVRFLLSHLDERGYITIPLEEVYANYPREVSPEEAYTALQIVQQMEPSGIGARNLQECLLLQINDETPYADKLRMLLTEHFDDLEHNRLPVIQKRTGFDIEIIQKAIQSLKHMNPRPGALYQQDVNSYVTPDLIVEKMDDGEYRVRILDDYIPDVYISRRYHQLKEKTKDPKVREFLARKIQSARWLKDAIEQRRSTLLKVAQTIIDHQKAFLDHGPDFLVPLKMQQIARQVDVHVTTISRAVAGKWIQTPRGLLPLKRFFSGGQTTESGEEVSWEMVKRKLLEIIEQEDKRNPYSDDALVEKMKEAGFSVARRTISKYRDELKIPSSRQRKDWRLVEQS